MHIFPVDLSPKSNCTHNLNIENVNWIKILHQKSLKYFILVSISPPHLHNSDVIDVTHVQEVPIFVTFPPPLHFLVYRNKICSRSFSFHGGGNGIEDSAINNWNKINTNIVHRSPRTWRIKATRDRCNYSETSLALTNSAPLVSSNNSPAMNIKRQCLELRSLILSKISPMKRHTPGFYLVGKCLWFLSPCVHCMCWWWFPRFPMLFMDGWRFFK